MGQSETRQPQQLLLELGGKEVNFAGQSLADWQAAGHEQGSIVADPGFADPQKDDFQLAPDSPAVKLGFKPFDAGQAGVYGDPAWVAKAKDVTYPPLEIAPEPPQVSKAQRLPLLLNIVTQERIPSHAELHPGQGRDHHRRHGRVWPGRRRHVAGARSPGRDHGTESGTLAGRRKTTGRRPVAGRCRRMPAGPADWKTVIGQTLDRFGRLDVLINNHGAGVKIAEVEEMSDDDIQTVLDVNLASVIKGCREVIPVMKRQGRGQIINVSSGCAYHSWPKWAIYTAAKDGMVGFTRCLHLEMAALGRQGDVVHPGRGPHLLLPGRGDRRQLAGRLPRRRGLRPHAGPLRRRPRQLVRRRSQRLGYQAGQGNAGAVLKRGDRDEADGCG